MSRIGCFSQRLLRVAHSLYRALEGAVLSERIRAIHIRSRGTYRAPRIHAELVATGICVGRKRIA